MSVTKRAWKEGDDTGKFCRVPTCGRPLVVGETISPSVARNGDWLCRECGALQKKARRQAQAEKLEHGQDTGKTCRVDGCDTRLIVGETIYPGDAAASVWRCKTHTNQAYADWAKANPEKKAASDAKWVKENPAKKKALDVRRKNREKDATPSWLTDADWKSMNEWYQIRDFFNGLDYEPLAMVVDHVVPLAAEIDGIPLAQHPVFFPLAGMLHSPVNLLPLPADINGSKSNKVTRKDLLDLIARLEAWTVHGKDPDHLMMVAESKRGKWGEADDT